MMQFAKILASTAFAVPVITMSFSVMCLSFGKNVGKSRSSVMRNLIRLKGGSADVNINEELKPFYALGVNVARQVGSELKNILSKEELQSMLQGFNDSMLDKFALDEERNLLMAYGPKLNELIQSRASEKVAKENLKATSYIADYLTANPGAKATPSGLIYHETLAGSGKQATLDATVLVHYHGKLLNGVVFDSSLDRGEPIKFPLKNVIKGWQEGVSMMKIGGKATLICPPDLAYGDSGSPPVIAPGATLVFDVELLDVL